MHHPSIFNLHRPTSALLLALVACLSQSLLPLRAHGLQPDTAPSTPAGSEPPLAEPVLRALAAAYLTPDEARDLRIFHGDWKPADLDTPARRARAALASLAIAHQSLSDPLADPLDRADAALLRGELEAALNLLKDASSPRAVRIRAFALASRGSFAEALTAAAPTLADLAAGTLDDPTAIVEAVRLAALIARLETAADPAAPLPTYHTLMASLGQVRSKHSRLHHPALVEESALLLEKDNAMAAQEALAQARSLDLRSARSLNMLGRLAVDSFDFDAAERFAARLDELAPMIDLRAAPAEAAEHAAVGTSPYAAMIRARAAIKQNDPDLAVTLLDAALATFPRMRDLLALRAAADAVRYDFASADRRLAEFDTMSPGSPEAIFEVGKALAEARQYAQSAVYLEQARDRLPGWPQPYIELGLLHMQSGRDDEARAALRTATRLDPFNVRADNSLRLAEDLATYERVESDHFIVRYKPAAPRPDGSPAPAPDAILAREMLGPLEANHAIVCGDGPGGIRHEPAQKTVIDLLPDHPSFGVRIVGMPRIHTIAAATGPVIAMESPRDGPKHLGTYDWPRVLRHEYTHTVTLSRTGNRIPHWFTEAAAVFLEQSSRDYQTCELLTRMHQEDGLFDLNGINLGFIRPRRPIDRPLAYAQGHWMYQFIVETWGSEAPLKLMDLYAQGAREQAAFTVVLGTTQSEFLERFHQWAAGELTKWGMREREGEPTLAEILETAQTASPEALTFDELRPLLEKHPGHAALLELAIAKWAAEHDGAVAEGAEDLLRQYAGARPVDPMPHRHLAAHFLTKAADQGRFSAIEHLEYLDAREQKSAAFAAELAGLYAQRAASAAAFPGDWANATAKSERATQIAPFDADYRELAARVAIRRSDFDTAQRHLEALVAIEPDRSIHAQRLESFKALRVREGR